MRYRAVILDMGHTLWGWPQGTDVEPLLARSYAAIEARLRDAFPGATVPEAARLRRVVADTLKAEHESYLQRSASIRDGDVWQDEALAQPRTETLFRSMLDGLSAPQPGDELLAWIIDTALSAEIETLSIDDAARAALETLHGAGVRLGAVTNTYQTERGIRRAMRDRGVEHLFSALVVSADFGYRKPHAGLYRAAADGLGVAPANCLFVGDRALEDVRGPRAAGMITALSHQWRQEPPDGVSPDHVIAHLRELPAIVLAQGGP